MYILFSPENFDEFAKLIPTKKIEGDDFAMKPTAEPGTRLFNYSNQKPGFEGMILLVFDGSSTDLTSFCLYDAIITSILVVDESQKDSDQVAVFSREIQDSYHHSPIIYIKNFYYQTMTEFMKFVIAQYLETMKA